MTANEFEMAVAFHGHKCPAMPLGYRAAEAAMARLGVKRAQDKELYVISETGKGHAAGCFLDGIMSATGCTYGKSNIEKRYYNKMAFTLIDVTTGRSIRVRLNDDFFANMLRSAFVERRKQGIAPQNIPAEVTNPLVDKILAMPEANFLEFGPIATVDLPRVQGCFETQLCERCGERVFSNRLTDTPAGRLCIPCQEQLASES